MAGSTRRSVMPILLFAVVSTVLVATPAHAAPGDPSCDGRPATLVGTEGADQLLGSNKVDVIVALGGNDTIFGDNGDDVICAGDGADRVSGGEGDDHIFGGEGDDKVTGENGADVIDTGNGADEATGANGDDRIDTGRGVDAADGGRGDDTCANAERTAGCETIVDPEPEVAVVFKPDTGCKEALALDADTPDVVVSDGDVIAYDITVRNDPTGACLGAIPTLSGTITFTSDLQGQVTVTDRSVWLETTDGRVLPLSAGLRTDGGSAPAGCPGGTPDGCRATIGNTVGNVSYPAGDTLVIPSGDKATIEFRFFPVLSSADVAVLAAGPVTAAFAWTSDDGTVKIERAPVLFAQPPTTGTVTVHAELPSGTETASLGPIAPGSETTANGLFTHTVVPGDPDQLTSSFVASTDASKSPADMVTSTVIVDSDTLPLLAPVVWPTTVGVGDPTGFVVSAAPRGSVQGPVTVRWPGGSMLMVDDGSGADLVDGDSVWTAAFNWTPTTPGTAQVTVDTVVLGTTATGTALIAVHAAGTPTGPEPLEVLNVIDNGASSFLADRIVVVTDPAATAADVAEASAAVNGTVVGMTGPGFWQVAIPAVTDKTALDATLAKISAHPTVVGAQPSFAGTLDTVEPSDTRFGDQTNITVFDLDDAWTFQTGTARRLVIAVIDSGVNLDHPDLDGKLVTGRDIRDGDNDPNDDLCLHGSHVAGIAAAESNNGAGIAGVNWGARILPVKVFHPTASGCGAFRYDDIAAAIDFAVARGATVLNMSLSGPDRSEDVARALDGALDANRMVVATAGNTGSRQRRYPSGFERSERFTSWFGLFSRTYQIDILSVGNMNDNRTRAATSTFGPWVDIVAPGQNVLSTFGDARPYERLSGTSMAAPYVAGVLSLMRSDDTGLTPGEARSRLQATGLPLEREFGPSIRPYEAIVNGSFEAGLGPWSPTGTVTTPSRIGPVTPRDGNRMLALSSGPDDAETTATLRRSFRVPSGSLDDGALTVMLRYNYLSEEYPEFVKAGFNDTFTVDLVLSNGSRSRIVSESVDTTAWTPVTGINFPGGDATVGQSGWRTGQVTLPAANLVGVTTFELVVTDNGDAIFDSVGLIDRIRVS